MLASELISMVTQLMESVGNHPVRITEDGTRAVDMTHAAHVVCGDDHAIVLAAVDHPVEIEGDTVEVPEADGEIRSATLENSHENSGEVSGQ